MAFGPLFELGCLAIIAFITFVCLGHGVRRLKNLTHSAFGSAAKHLSPDRVPGEWEPIQFVYPNAEPHPAGKVENIIPAVHRPYKWGPDYHVTMGIKNLDWSQWIELDNEFMKYRRIREWRVKEHSDRIVHVLGNRSWKNAGEEVRVRSACPAVTELIEELVSFLCQRYPENYERIGQTKLRLRLEGTDVTYELVHSESCEQTKAKKLLELAALLTQDDFILMQEGSDGRYYLQAGIMCNAGSWRLQDKIGMRLDEIHTSGEVPRYKEKLQISMERFFRRLPVEKPVVRYNYGVQQVPQEPIKVDCTIDPEEFAWSALSLGPEDKLGTVSVTDDSDTDRQRPEATLNSLRLRVERQTLRRLPKSGTVVFGIRTYFTPFTDIDGKEEDGRRLRSALESWPEDVRTYKGWGGSFYSKLVQVVARL